MASALGSWCKCSAPTALTPNFFTRIFPLVRELKGHSISCLFMRSLWPTPTLLEIPKNVDPPVVDVEFHFNLHFVTHQPNETSGNNANKAEWRDSTEVERRTGNSNLNAKAQVWIPAYALFLIFRLIFTLINVRQTSACCFKWGFES